jgi:hypothetical protein
MHRQQFVDKLYQLLFLRDERTENTIQKIDFTQIQYRTVPHKCQHFFQQLASQDLVLTSRWNNNVYRVEWKKIEIFPECNGVWTLDSIIQFLLLLPFNVSTKNAFRIKDESKLQFTISFWKEILFYLTINLLDYSKTIIKITPQGLVQTAFIIENRSYSKINQRLQRVFVEEFLIRISLIAKISDSNLLFDHLFEMSSLLKNQLNSKLLFKFLTFINNSIIRHQKLSIPPILRDLSDLFLNRFQKTFASIQEMIHLINGQYRFYLKTESKASLLKLNLVDVVGDIEGFIYLTPEAKEIVKSPMISCIFLEATFSILPDYILSIVSVCICNSHLPLGFMIGKTESTKYYQRFYDFFRFAFDFNLSSFPVLSDRHKSLISFCQINSIQHFYCIVHVLRNVGTQTHMFYAIQKLLNLHRIELIQPLLVCLSNNLYDQFDDPILHKTLKKVGLMIINDSIVVGNNSDTFFKSFLAFRIEYGIPSSTNAIEAVHSHLNEFIPRHNTNIHGLITVMSEITNRYSIFNQAIQKNYVYQTNQLLSEFNSICKEDLSIECHNLASTNQSCCCLSTLLISKMFNLDIPCKHRQFLGARILPKTKIILPIFEAPIQETNVSWTFISEETLNKQPKKECGPLTNFEYKTDREDLTPISRIFEEVVDIAIQLRNVKDKKIREQNYEEFLPKSNIQESRGYF